MNRKPTRTMPTTAAIVTAFCPRVKPEAKRRAPSRTCAKLAGTSAMSLEAHVHDVVVRRHGFLEQRRGDLRVERGLRGGDHRVGEVALTGGRERFVVRSGCLSILDGIDRVGDCRG